MSAKPAVSLLKSGGSVNSVGALKSTPLSKVVLFLKNESPAKFASPPKFAAPETVSVPVVTEVRLSKARALSSDSIVAILSWSAFCVSRTVCISSARESTDVLSPPTDASTVLIFPESAETAEATSENPCCELLSAAS